MDEEGPDPNDVRRHAKKMLTELEYRRRYRRLDFYRPNRKQLEFHNTLQPERMLRAGNQEGKTHAAAAENAMHATQLYPDWFKGRRFLKNAPVERPFDFLSWVAAPFAQKVRDGMQTKLLGNIMEDGGLGTGLVPLDSIVGRPAMGRGIAEFVDTITLRREDGGRAVIRFKTYEQGRQAFEGEACDVICLDEDIKGEINAAIYGECQARTTTTRGIIMVTMTPLLGLTPIRRRFKEKHPGTEEILMGLQDALVSNGGHIPDEDVPRLLQMYPEHERMTRLYGADMQGEGAVFATPVERITHTLNPVDVPPYWPWMWGIDFRHSGSETTGHPFAAALATWDRDSNTIYIMHTVRMLGLAPMHVAAMKSHPRWQAPVAWPHDGGRGASIVSGETIAGTYRRLGLNMLSSHAEFASGGNNFEAGIRDMEERFASQRLKIAAHLSQALDEYRGYHRENGAVVKIDDDIMSAIRVICMDIRHAKATGAFTIQGRAEDSRMRFSRGTPNHPDGSFDLFTGS